MAQTKIEQGLLKFTEATDYLKIPTGTTAQRPSSPANGYIRFNTTINDVEAYNGTEWTRMGVAPPSFSSVDYPGSATALDPAGGESLVINGTQFNIGITITIGGTTPSTITRNSSTQLTVTAPAKTAGTYDIVFTNTDGGTATATNAVSYNGVPAFTNAAGSLGSVDEDSAVNLSAAATEPDGGAITYAITSGSLPSGLSLNSSTGAITGTAPSVSADTTSNFTVTATDNENQTASRAYSITVTDLAPSSSFNTVLYTGNGSTQSITGVGFQPDFVWLKRRNGTQGHRLIDSTTGADKYLESSSTSSQQGAGGAGLTSFDSDGFSLGSGAAHNINGGTFVAWCFKANGGTTSSNTNGTITSTVQVNNSLGFSIVKYTGNNTANATIGHGLSATPQLIISKNLSNGSAYWATYHHSIGITRKFYLNDTSTGDTVSGGWLDVSSTLITLKQINANNINENGSDFINYCFTEVEGFSKFGSYTGNGSTNGPIVETGFEPAFLMIKQTNDISNWVIVDNKRNTSNPRNTGLRPNTSDTESTVSNNLVVDFLSNGFQLKQTSGSNANNGNFIYMAFAADPDTTSPTLADSFNALTWTGNGTSNRSFTGLGFQPNLVWAKVKSGYTFNHTIYDSVRGPERFISSDSNAAERVQDGSGYLTSFDSDGFSTTGGSPYGNEFFNKSGGTYVTWAWKADDNEPTIEKVTSNLNAVAVYKFEDNVNDVTSTYNGTATDITYNSSGKFNKSAIFNGSSSKVTVGNWGLTSNKDFSTSFWFKADSLSGDQWLYGQGANSGNFDAHSIYLRNNTTIFHDNRGNSDALSTSLSLSTGTWYHFAYTYNASTGVHTGYINGASIGTTTRTLDLQSNNSGGAIGTREISGSYYFDGEIDQFRVYHATLTSSHITTLYNETASDNDDLNLGMTYVSSIESIVSANANAGFSIVKYTGNGLANQRVPHGLSAAPELIIAKANIVSSWVVYTATTGTNKFLELNNDAAEQTISNYWGTSSPSATTFGVAQSNSNNNSTGNEIIAYCFHSVSGFSKIGSYSGSGASGNAQNVGFAPDLVIVKSTNAVTSWGMFDTVRGANVLYSNLSNAQSADSRVTLTSTGFEFTGAAYNETGRNWIYMAFKIN